MWPNGPFWSLQDASCSLLIGKALRIAVSEVMMNVHKLYILSWLVTHTVSTRELSVHLREGCCHMMCNRKIHDLDPTSTRLSMILTTLVLSSKSKWSWVLFVKCYKIDLKTLDKCLIQDKVVIFKKVADHLNTILLIICKTENNIMILLGFSIIF